MWRDHFTPGLQPGCNLGFQCECFLAGLLAGLILKHRAHQFSTRGFQFLCLFRRGNRGQQPLCGIQRTQGVIGTEGLFVREVITDLPQLTHIRAFRVPEDLLEYLIPVEEHRLEE